MTLGRSDAFTLSELFNSQRGSHLKVSRNCYWKAGLALIGIGTLGIVGGFLATDNFNAGTMGALGSWLGGIGAVLAIVWAVDQISSDHKRKSAKELRTASLVATTCEVRFKRDSEPSWQSKGNDGLAPNYVDSVQVNITNGSGMVTTIEKLEVCVQGGEPTSVPRLPIVVAPHSSHPAIARVATIQWKRIDPDDVAFPSQSEVQVTASMEYIVDDVRWKRQGSDLPERLNRD